MYSTALLQTAKKKFSFEIPVRYPYVLVGTKTSYTKRASTQNILRKEGKKKVRTLQVLTAEKKQKKINVNLKT